MQELKLTITGLYTHPNPFSAVPAGALAVADNLVIDRESEADSRRGFRQYGDPIEDADTLLLYRDKLFLHAPNTLYRDSDDAGTWVALSGTWNPPSIPLKIRSQEFNRNLYLTTSIGIHKLDNPASGSPILAGMPRALDLNVAQGAVGTAVIDNAQVAYRVLWGRRDANENLILGAPSVRAVYTNSSGATRDVTINFTIPAGILAGDFYQLYRSLPSADATVSPNDELQLALEKTVSAGDVTAGVITVTDTTPDDALGATIYTSPTQEGILQSNYPPPFALDLCELQQHIFYGNIKDRQTLNATLTTNPAVGNTITINSVAYAAAVAENIAAAQFKIGTDTVATIESLIRVVNRYNGTDNIYLYSLDGASFQAEARDFTEPAFSMTASPTSLFSVTLPINSTNNMSANQVAISKAGQAEAVPALNRLRLGSADKAIKRVLSTRDAVFIEKEDGVYRITGTDITNFVAEKHDITMNIIGPNTAGLFENMVFMMGNQGEAAISVNGVTNVSLPVQVTLLELAQFDNFTELAWGTGYDSDRKYLLACPSNSIDTAATQIFVYNTRTNSWTRWDLSTSHGLVDSRDDKLYLIRATDGQVLQERKSFTLADYADDEFTMTISSHTINTVTVVLIDPNVTIGMTLKQDTSASVITDISGNTMTVELGNLLWDDGMPIIAYTPIMNAIQWLQDPAQNAGILKHFREVTYIFRDARFINILALFRTNFSQGFDRVAISAPTVGAWGEFPWGDEEWGGGVGGFNPLRTLVPRNAARAHWLDMRLELSQAFNAFSLLGASLMHEPMDSRFQGARSG